jgi:8-oxo-dGTP pyrophosphatase MutT (NUDIX family)
VRATTPIDRLDCALIRERLALAFEQGEPGAELELPPHRLAGEPMQRAAVLLPLYRRDGSWHLVFIRRAEHEQDRHSGEVGFPGGRWQPGDPSCVATALREAEEEIGLPAAQVALLGELRPFRTVSRYLVTPVVGCFDWPQPLKPDPREVSRIFSIPLSWLGTPGRHRVQVYPAPDHPEARDVIFFEEYDGERLWGITARIALDFLACLDRP